MIIKKTNLGKIKWHSTYLALQVHSLLTTKNLRSVPSVAANTLQPVEVIFVEDLRWKAETTLLEPTDLHMRRKPQMWMMYLSLYSRDDSHRSVARWLSVPAHTLACQAGRSTGAGIYGSQPRWSSSECCVQTLCRACLEVHGPLPLSSHSFLCTDAKRHTKVLCIGFDDDDHWFDVSWCFTHIQYKFSSFDASCSTWVILKTLGQTVQGLKLLIIFLIFNLCKSQMSNTFTKIKQKH